MESVVSAYAETATTVDDPRMTTMYPSRCSIPGCAGAAPAAHADDPMPRLCFDHGAMLFYDVDEFLRVWDDADEKPDPIGR
jgi:hypothetical protein